MNQQFKHTPPTAGAIAFVQARWHAEIVDQSRLGFLERWRQSPDPAPVEIFDAPGSFDIPLLASRLAASGRYAAIIAAGFVVDGGVYRHDFVAATVIEALMRVQLDHGVPVISAVLTPHHFQETPAHQRFFAEHFRRKGAEAADACRRIVETFARLDAAQPLYGPSAAPVAGSAMSS